MDCISNGLDTATTFDIIKSIRIINQKFGTTNVLSLLQVRMQYCCNNLLRV